MGLKIVFLPAVTILFPGPHSTLLQSSLSWLVFSTPPAHHRTHTSCPCPPPWSGSRSICNIPGRPWLVQRTKKGFSPPKGLTWPEFVFVFIFGSPFTPLPNTEPTRELCSDSLSHKVRKPTSSTFWHPSASPHICSGYIPVGGGFLGMKELEFGLGSVWRGVRKDIARGRNSASNGVRRECPRAKLEMNEGDASLWPSCWADRERILLPLT